MSAGDVWGTIPCPYCTDHQVSVRETRKATGQFHCSGCKGTGFFNETRTTFAARYQLEAPAAPAAPKAKRTTKAKKSTTTPRKRKATHAPEDNAPSEAQASPDPQPRGIGAAFGFE